MNSIILFWTITGYEQSKHRPLMTPISSGLVASDLVVTRIELTDAFKWWLLADKPEGEYVFKINEKKYIRIFYRPDVFYLDGNVSLSRPWGNHWRGIGEYSFIFSVEPVIDEAS